ncbi:hypothetical protein CEXT_55261 [Caerostris extrusa]|uniref:Uncharacterized protein n=1 Tax=Caerostris extrusa TaxID=172846 RepID=A0AAV4QC36_CAEEX|nr:hypothetical protein CEXT_55261 [Caerostris extrusa]
MHSYRESLHTAEQRAGIKKKLLSMSIKRNSIEISGTSLRKSSMMNENGECHSLDHEVFNDPTVKAIWHQEEKRKMMTFQAIQWTLTDGVHSG